MCRQFIDIPRVTAATAHDGCTFLDLPAEVRNNVYKNIFEHEKPIQITYAGAGDGRAPFTSDVYPSIRNGINLLLSCRQVYHEAASVLYSRNKFMFSKGRDEHAQDFGQLQVAATWCSGFQAQYLRKVEIDVSKMCMCSVDRRQSEGCGHFWTRSVDLTSLAKTMRLRSTSECNFEFVQSYSRSYKRSGARPSDGELRMADQSLTFRTHTMNKILECLRTDTAGLKKYGDQVVSIVFW
ncbi:hypothetical protein BDW02DRAFT_473743, partial [Decorospora gaudefroyi]